MFYFWKWYFTTHCSSQFVFGWWKRYTSWGLEFGPFSLLATKRSLF